MQTDQQEKTASQLNLILHQNKSIQESIKVIASAHTMLTTKGAYNSRKVKGAMQVLVKKLDILTNDIETNFL